MTSDPEFRTPIFDLEIDDRRRDVALVRASGELDLAADALLGATLAQAEALERPIVVDMAQVTFCASSVLGQLAATAVRSARAGRPLLVATAANPVLRPLNVLGLARYLTVVPDVATAVRRLDLPGSEPAGEEAAPEGSAAGLASGDGR